MQAAAAAGRARSHPHRRSAAPRQRWPRVRAARRTKEHELEVDGLHRSSARVAPALRVRLGGSCTDSAGQRGVRAGVGAGRPPRGTRVPSSTTATKTEIAYLWQRLCLQGCKQHGTLRGCVPQGATTACAQRESTPNNSAFAPCCPWRRRWGRRPCALPARCTAAVHAAFAPRQLCRGSGAALQSGAESAPWLGFGTQGGWALEAWRLRSAPHYSASACACRPSPPASSRVQDQGHGH